MLKISEFIHCIHLISSMHLHNVTSGGRIAPYSHRLKRIWSFPILLGGGAAFVKPRKGRPELSYCHLRMIKISVFIHCIHLTTFMHLHVMSGGWIAPHSHRLKHTWSFPIFLGGGAAFDKPGKGCPEVSYCPLRMLKYQNSSIVSIW